MCPDYTPPVQPGSFSSGVGVWGEGGCGGFSLSCCYERMNTMKG